MTDFGIGSANCGGSYYSQTGGIDNFDVQLTHLASAVFAAPEPAALSTSRDRSS